MRIFLDTNVVLDLLTEREPFADDAEAAIELSTREGNQAVITTLSACNIVYVLSKIIGRKAAERNLDDFLTLVGLVGVEPNSVRGNLCQSHPDFEDSVQLSEAVKWQADVIVTRDPDGFMLSPILVVSPSEFLARYA